MPLLLTNGNIIDVKSGSILQNHQILIEEGIIKSIKPMSDNIQKNEVEVIDIQGQYVLPGLIDCHVHINAVSANLSQLAHQPPTLITPQAMKLMEEMLHRGFTTVRDAAGADWGIAEAVEQGYVTSPRIIFGGQALSPTGGHGDGRTRGDYSEPHDHGTNLSRLCDGITEVRKACRDIIRSGGHHIKIMASGGVASPTDRIDSLQFSSKEIEAIVEEAANANLYVLAHAYTAVAINRALELGVRSIEHGNLLDKRSLELFLEKQAFLVPTLVTYYALKEDGLKYGLPRDSYDKIDTVLENGKTAIKMAHEAGVKMAFGTDLLGEMQERQLEEFALLAELMDPIDAIQSATIVAAELLQLEDKIGQIKEGMFADLLVYDQNPLEDLNVIIENKNYLKLVIKNGKIWSKRDSLEK